MFNAFIVEHVSIGTGREHLITVHDSVILIKKNNNKLPPVYISFIKFDSFQKITPWMKEKCENLT